jgi:hypothetical protein
LAGVWNAGKPRRRKVLVKSNRAGRFPAIAGSRVSAGRWGSAITLVEAARFVCQGAFRGTRILFNELFHIARFLDPPDSVEVALQFREDAAGPSDQGNDPDYSGYNAFGGPIGGGLKHVPNSAALFEPTSPPISSTIFPCAASCPSTSPAIEMARIRSGAIENVV